MSIIDFIEQDSQKIKHTKKWHYVLIVIFFIFSLIIGYATRRDFIEAFEIFNVVPSFFLVLFATIFLFVVLKNKPNPYYYFLASLFYLTTLTQTQTHISLSKFSNINMYWSENLHCLEIGTLGGLFVSTMAIFIIIKFFPILSLKKIFSYSVFISMSSSLILSLHCPGPLKTHIVISHWGSSLIINLLCTYFLYTLQGKKY